MLGRSVLLALTALSACAATTPPGSAQTGSYQPEQAGAYGSFLVGQYAASRYDFPRAATAMRQALSDDPAAAPALSGETFLLELLAGNAGTASAIAATLPKDSLAQLLLAGSDARAGHWQDALRRYQALPTPDPLTSVLKPLLVAWAQQGSGNTRAALATLQTGSMAQARSIVALHTALIADQGKMIAIAAQNYGIVQGGMNVTNLRLSEVLASWDARTGDMTSANQVLDSLSPDLAMAMTLPAIKKQLMTPPVANAAQGLAEVYVNLAAALEDELANSPQRGEHPAAQQTVMTMLQLGLQLRPDLSSARLLLSEVVDKGNNAAVALAPLQAIDTSDPLYPLAALREAVLLTRLGQGDQAQSLLQQLAQAYPWSPEPILAQADLLRQSSQFTDAIALYTKALPLMPPNSPAGWVVYYDRAMCYDQAKDWPRTQADLQQALTLSPGQPYVLNYLGYSWAVKKENMPKARAMIEQALQLVPNDGAIIDSLGYVLLQQGQAQAAVRTLTQAVKLIPEDPTINAHLGDAYAAAGEHLQAVFQWRRALQLDPAPDLTTELLAKLQIKAASLPAAAQPAASN
ncbi:tetratricopeptide repeat protein [Acidisoma cellulosilytica]|uniref:Tetratricopeptide repeat protein n=1 Tax=Acidisoma cellulosilyticum TaxID=2802395 RepID=A0A963Z5M3_9PROT|nr:tetratricopeptide repeat protein [Acidisoma cellulosilyticum]MCB8883345.1 tetratricopeptide repeat protein [Acidisoma cellulosilyticum]